MNGCINFLRKEPSISHRDSEAISATISQPLIDCHLPQESGPSSLCIHSVYGHVTLLGCGISGIRIGPTRLDTIHGVVNICLLRSLR
jgi:hypothetical protein